MCKYVAETYPKGISAVYCTRGKDIDGPGNNFDLVAIISASKKSPQNFWYVYFFATG
jgi:capping protein (actin filament) muscle Z-line, alpha